MTKASKAAVLLGVMLSLGLVAISAALNFRVAYRTGDTELDAWIYGSGAAIADGLKALLPFFVWAAWTRRHVVSACAGIVLFALFSAYSFTAGLGYVAQLRDIKRGERTGSMEARASVKAEIARLDERARLLGPQRGSGEIAAEIEQVLKQPVKGQTLQDYSRNCTVLRRVVREGCRRVAALTTELKRAEESERVAERLGYRRQMLVELGQTGAERSDDPQRDALARLLKRLHIDAEREDIEAGLVVLVGLLFEVGSGLGLYVVTTPTRQSRKKRRKGGEATEGTEGHGMDDLEIVAGARRIGDVEEFALERLVQNAESSLPSTRIYQGYAQWCRERGEAPLIELEFMFRFEEIARVVGMHMRQRGGNIVYDGVALGAG